MKKYSYEDLVHIIELLRSDKGCPWDREQTHETLIPCILEESYELVDAIRNKDTENLKEELGDVLMQVIMHAQIAKEEETFTLEEVVDDIAKKLVYRHPHVFGNEMELSTSEEVLNQWEILKKKEKNQKTQSETMQQVAKALPALIRAQKIQKKAAEVGFKGGHYSTIIDKIQDQLEVLKNEIKSRDKDKINEEMGDLLFGVVNLSYFLEINPEFALTNSTEKFINRFRYIENSAFAEGKQLSQMTLEEMDRLWEQCKKVESNI